MDDVLIKLCLNKLYDALHIIEEMQNYWNELYCKPDSNLTEDDYVEMDSKFTEWYDYILDITSNIEEEYDII